MIERAKSMSVPTKVLLLFLLSTVALAIAALPKTSLTGLDVSRTLKLLLPKTSLTQPYSATTLPMKVVDKPYPLFQEVKPTTKDISSPHSISQARWFVNQYSSIKLNQPKTTLHQSIAGERTWVITDRLPGKNADTFIDVNAKAGTVESYVSMRKQSEVPGSILSKTKALGIAKIKARELGVPSGYALNYAARDDSGSRRPLWVFEWVRKINGVEYFAASYMVTLHADTGELAGYMKGPGNGVAYKGTTKPEISQKQAINKALAYIKSHSGNFHFSELKNQGTAKLVIGSRSFDKKGRTVFNAPPQLIWTVEIAKKSARPSPDETDFSGTIMINVDALSGEVIGKDETR